MLKLRGLRDTNFTNFHELQNFDHGWARITGAAGPAKTAGAWPPFSVNADYPVAARTNFSFLVLPPTNGVPYCVRWEFQETEIPKTP